MLKRFYDTFQITESQLTKASLMRLKLAALIGLAPMPLVTVMSIIEVTGLALYVMISVKVIAIPCFIYVACAGITNRVWVPDKYLDENEIQIKHKSAYKTYFWTSWVLFIILLSPHAAERLLDLQLSDYSVNDVLYDTIASIWITMLCLQSYFAASSMQPLEGDDDRARSDNNKIDFRYKLFLTIASGMLSRSRLPRTTRPAFS